MTTIYWISGIIGLVSIVLIGIIELREVFFELYIEFKSKTITDRMVDVLLIIFGVSFVTTIIFGYLLDD